jgi:hypothetical protein
MSTDLKLKSETALTVVARNPFEQYADGVGSSHFVGALLKFTKGDYLAGPDAED